MMDCIGVLFGVTVLAVMCGGATCRWRQEYIEWNDGICQATGKPWRQFDTDIQGGRMYKSGCHYLDVSYPVDAKKEW